MSEPIPPEPAVPPAAETPDAAAPEAEAPARDGRPFLYAGCGLLVLSFLLSWWGLTKYRVPEERGVPPEKIGEVAKDFDEEDKKEYAENKDRYQRSWADNLKQYATFYKDNIGAQYHLDLEAQDARNWKSGSIYFRGWSTWTGWFAVIFVVMMLTATILPHFVPQLQPWAWGFPWAGAILFGLVTLMAVTFYFTVPDENGDGYSQGVSLGNYLAIVGGILATAGCVFEGMRTIDQGIATMQARTAAAEEEAEEEEEEEPSPKPKNAPPPSPPKSRLQDW